MKKKRSIKGENYPSILNREFDIIFIESFGHNPLSDYPLEEGLKKQEEALDSIVSKLKDKHGCKAHIVFMATISPNSQTYGQGVVELTPEDRQRWVAEREAYIENHIKYAQEHNILLLDLYNASRGVSNNGDQRYINREDNIHPSQQGVAWINQEIAKFVFQNRLLPQ